jgi:glycosyltransferase A (GT-A) superfamily protein (DUF2064 family)
MKTNLLVLAKTPVPGRVKTRLCPPCTPRQAALIAAAAIDDTVATVSAAPAGVRTLVADGDLAAPEGWARVPQRGGPLAERIAHAYADAHVPGTTGLLIGMDTPQIDAGLLGPAMERLGRDDTDAVLGLAEDGGWWALGLRDPRYAGVIRSVPTSTADTGALTLAALRAQGLRVAMLPTLIDVDTAADARAVAALCPAGSRFAGAVRAVLPQEVAA